MYITNKKGMTVLLVEKFSNRRLAVCYIVIIMCKFTSTYFILKQIFNHFVNK